VAQLTTLVLFRTRLMDEFYCYVELTYLLQHLTADMLTCSESYQSIRKNAKFFQDSQSLLKNIKERQYGIELQVKCIKIMMRNYELKNIC
jgi:hypothetical protein